jgi:hypothetical protein
VESISPELVLVDPELAKRARALLPPMPWAVFAPVATTAIPGGRPTPKRVPTHAKLFALGALAVGLLYLVVLQLHRGVDGSATRPTAAPTITTTPRTSSTLNRSAAPTSPHSVFSPPAHHQTTLSAGSRIHQSRQNAPAKPATQAAVKPAATARVATRAAAERTVLLLLQKLPRGALPRGLIDPVTMLVKTNVQVTCRRVAHASFRCLVDDPATRSRLPVVYHANLSGPGALSLTSRPRR